MIEDDTDFYEQNQRQKAWEEEWARMRRLDYYKCLERAAKQPPDEDEWNK